MNRKEDFAWDTTSFLNYCKIIQNQDPGCYCNLENSADSKCGDAFLGGDTVAKSVLSQARSPQNELQNREALANLGTVCGCNPICTTWIANEVDLPVSIKYKSQSCQPSSMVLNFCGVSLDSQTGGKISTGPVNVTQNCSASTGSGGGSPSTTNNTTTTPVAPADPATPPKPVTITTSTPTWFQKNKILVVSGVVATFLILILIIMLKK